MKKLRILAAAICLIGTVGCTSAPAEKPIGKAEMPTEIKERLSKMMSKEEVQKRYDFVQSDMKGRVPHEKHR